MYERNHNWFEEAFNELSFWREFFSYPAPAAPYIDEAYLATFTGASKSVITVSRALYVEFDGTSLTENMVVDVPGQGSSLGFLFTDLAGAFVLRGGATFKHM
mmetsp:Transcript_33868/g.52202  ORF Transcript_33868/g.52202 Transcript_33868/m.52202 type:complete len:102 (+) Transcript_33868:238-543(+)